MATIAVSYSGLLGGAERVLLEMASGLEEPPLIACPPGPLADAARARGLGVFELRERSLELRRSPLERAAAARRLAAQAAELRSLVAAVRPDTLVAWGMRAALSTSAVARAPGTRLVVQHNDLLPGPLIGRALRAPRAPSRARRGAFSLRRRATWIRTARSASACASFPPGSTSSASGRARRPTGSEVLLLGAVEPWKRPDLALEAVALAARELPELRLTVAGEPVGAEGERLLDELAPPRRASRPSRAGDLRGSGCTSPSARSRLPPACSTAPSASPTAWSWPRHSQPECRWWHPTPVGRPSCSTATADASMPPAMRPPPRARSATC